MWCCVVVCGLFFVLFFTSPWYIFLRLHAYFPHTFFFLGFSVIIVSSYLCEEFASWAAMGDKKYIGFGERAGKKEKKKSENTDIKHLQDLAVPGSEML